MTAQRPRLPSGGRVMLTEQSALEALERAIEPLLEELRLSDVERDRAAFNLASNPELLADVGRAAMYYLDMRRAR